MTGVAPGLAVILLPVWLLFGVIVALGLGLWLAALNVRFRDVRQSLAFLLQTWLFVSPVVYASSLVQGDLLWALFALNPRVGLIDGLRWSLVNAPEPPLVDLLSVATTLTLLIRHGCAVRDLDATR